jgi:hypothetical protein
MAVIFVASASVPVPIPALALSMSTSLREGVAFILYPSTLASIPSVASFIGVRAGAGVGAGIAGWWIVSSIKVTITPHLATKALPNSIKESKDNIVKGKENWKRRRGEGIGGGVETKRRHRKGDKNILLCSIILYSMSLRDEMACGVTAHPVCEPVITVSLCADPSLRGLNTWGQAALSASEYSLNEGVTSSLL